MKGFTKIAEVIGGIWDYIARDNKLSKWINGKMSL